AGQEILNQAAHEQHPNFVKNATVVVCERFPNGRIVYAECSVLSSAFALATQNPVEVTYGFIVKGETFVTIDDSVVAADSTGDL
nr:hypothetical protein [Gammaproteobacteria bacterium]